MTAVIWFLSDPMQVFIATSEPEPPLEPMDEDPLEKSASAAEAPETPSALRRYGASAYLAFLNLVNALMDGSTENGRYEESCRQLLGNRGYIVTGIDKVNGCCDASLPFVI